MNNNPNEQFNNPSINNNVNQQQPNMYQQPVQPQPTVGPQPIGPVQPEPTPMAQPQPNMYQQPVQPQPRKKNALAIVLVIVLVLAIVGVVLFFVLRKPDNSSNTQKSNNTNVPVENTNTNVPVENTNTVKESNSSTARASSIENPLAVGEWGYAGKYVSEYLADEYKDISYKDVPVRVTNIIRGAEARAKVEEFVKNNSYYIMQDKDGFEWVVAEYEVDLTGLTFKEDGLGTRIDINSSVRGLDGNSVKYNNTIYILTTTDMSSRDYVEEPGIYKGSFSLLLPEGCTEYLFKMGSSINGEGSEMYVRGR